MTDAFLRLVEQAAPEELPRLAAALEGARVRLEQRLATARWLVSQPSSATDPVARFLTPEEAAAIAQIPVKRLYEWARKKPWAHRPNARTLRIHEQGFRKWLEAR